jgi:phosphodiesterase/alkaline phosphatase D-like protein
MRIAHRPSTLSPRPRSEPVSDLLLGPLLRYQDSSSATIWVEVSAPATVEVLGTTTTTFTIADRHYAFVIIEGLEAGTVYQYEVRIDGEVAWPEPGSALPPSVIRTEPIDGFDGVKLVVGSCRAAAPHEEPYTLERVLDDEGRGIDALWAHAERLIQAPVDSWPHLALLNGDQIYADDSSPQARDRIERLRPDDSELPPEIVADYEEYCWLYHESWSLTSERWFLSTVPSAMIFDDHDMIDDWNISASWIAERRGEPWWQEHAIGGLMSYWVYQHLGNMSPAEIRSDGMFQKLIQAGDGTDILRSWAEAIDANDGEGVATYRFSHARRVGDVDVISIDTRHARSFEGGRRLMVGDAEWDWVRERALACSRHVVLVSSVPVYISDGLHDFQVWSERICDGAWGGRAAGLGEKLRRSLDLEDWSAFHESFLAFGRLIRDLCEREQPPRSIVVASGDIHYSYAARIPNEAGERAGVPIWQVVSSPMRNALIPPERGVMRFTLTRAGRVVGALLRRLVKAPDSRVGLELSTGPLFANNLAVIEYTSDEVWLAIEHDEPGDDGTPELADIPRVQLV